jgi:hypothetical protein
MSAEYTKSETVALMATVYMNLRAVESEMHELAERARIGECVAHTGHAIWASYERDLAKLAFDLRRHYTFACNGDR